MYRERETGRGVRTSMTRSSATNEFRFTDPAQARKQLEKRIDRPDGNLVSVEKTDHYQFATRLREDFREFV